MSFGQAVFRPRSPLAGRFEYDPWLAVAVVLLLGLGLIMVASSSVSMASSRFDQPLYYFQRQLLALLLGLGLGFMVTRMPMRLWQILSIPLLAIGYLLLVLVLIPGIGTEINGSTRWIRFFGVSFQVSELVKLCVLVYLADYLVRHDQAVRQRFHGLLVPIGVLTSLSALLLLEPDFGAGVVLFAAVLGMLFLAGVPLLRYFSWGLVALSALGTLVVCSSYRMQRMISFLDPWQDPYGDGFQLTQALIAFGRGEMFGVGVGDGVQKLFYLPEAHTDFMFAVLAEELGLLGSLVIILAYLLLVWRAFSIASVAEYAGRPFSALLAYGIGLLIGVQAFINVGVNMGVLPTKGLTLPLMSYGGSSLVVFCLLVAILFRVSHENRHAWVQARPPSERIWQPGREGVRAHAAG